MKRFALIAAYLATGVALAAPEPPPELPKLSAEQVIERNLAAIGGAPAWRAVKTMVLEGEMDVGGNPPRQLPYVLKQKRGLKSRLEVKLKEQTLVQVFDGKNGWKIRPFTNRNEVEPMSAQEAATLATSDEIGGPLIDAAQNGTRVALVGTDRVEGHAAYRLRLTGKSGHSRDVWVDGSSFLVLRIDGEPRQLDGRPHAVQVYMRDYRPEQGLVMAHTQETVVLQFKGAPSKTTIAHARVNEALGDETFAKPAPAATVAAAGR